MTSFERGLKGLATEKIEWCIGYLERNTQSFSAQEKVVECVEAMKRELESRE